LLQRFGRILAKHAKFERLCDLSVQRGNWKEKLADIAIDGTIRTIRREASAHGIGTFVHLRAEIRGQVAAHCSKLRSLNQT